MTADIVAVIWMLAAMFNVFVILPVIDRAEAYISYRWFNPLVAPITTAIMAYYIVIKSIQQSIIIITRKHNNDR